MKFVPLIVYTVWSMVILVVEFSSYLGMQISFEDIDFWSKIFLILHPSLENSTTHITIVRRLKKFHFIAVGAIGCNYPLKRERERRELCCCMLLCLEKAINHLSEVRGIPLAKPKQPSIARGHP